MSENNSDKYRPNEAEKTPGELATALVNKGIVSGHLTGISPSEEKPPLPIDILPYVGSEKQLNHLQKNTPPKVGPAKILPFRRK